VRNLDDATRHTKSMQVCRSVLASDWWQRASLVFVYLAAEFEVDTSPLLEAAWRDGKRVLVPRREPSSRGLVAVEIRDWLDCLPAEDGLLEPLPGATADLSEAELAVLPGLGFDLRGARLGRGRGAYEGLFAPSTVRAHRCGLAFEEQVVEHIQVPPSQRLLHSLVTDAAVRTLAVGA
jgi:5-formyltetrahydrofolate cyclo-ligase